MKRVQLLDCTLRDGGYLVDAQFGNTVIKGMIKGLSESGIDVVECGFLKDEPHQKGSTIFNNAAQLRPFLPEDRRQTSYVCLADYSRYTISNLEPFDGTSIDGVRACFFKKERYDVIDFCKSIVEKKKGIVFSKWCRQHHFLFKIYRIYICRRIEVELQYLN